MDITGSSFTLRKNAKRAAEAMIRKGTALAVDYDIKPRDDGRFEIVWKTAKTAPTTDEVETEIIEASADQPAAASPTEACSQPAPAATEPVTTDAPPQPMSQAEAVPQPAPAATEPVPASSEPAPKNEWPRGTRVMVRKLFREADIRAYGADRDAPPAKQPRRTKATAAQKAPRSRYAIDPEAIAAGKLPDKAPVVTSKANPHYQKHFDRLFALAKAGDWDAVRDYKVTGSNSYSKMVARYRRDLLAVHAASEAAQ